MLLRNYTQDPHFPHYDQTNGENVVLKQSEKVILQSNLWEVFIIVYLKLGYD